MKLIARILRHCLTEVSERSHRRCDLAVRPPSLLSTHVHNLPTASPSGTAVRPPSPLTEEPTAAKAGRGELGGEVAEGEGAEGEVGNAAAGGFFGRYGRERTGPRPTVIPPASPAVASPAAASPAAASP